MKQLKFNFWQRKKPTEKKQSEKKMIEKRIDPYTGEEFMPKRRDQIFASDKNRRDFHNNKAASFREETREHMTKLHKNHNILIELVPEDSKKTFSLEFLKGKGYDINYCTSSIRYGWRTCKGLYNNFCIIHTQGSNKVTVVNKSEGFKMIKDYYPKPTLLDRLLKFYYKK